jgi:hypothetical protein
MHFLFLAAVTMVSAEVLSGSSPLWFINPWALLVTLPLYAVHIGVLWSCAVRWQRTHWAQLYGFGVAFALYESWITKVLWAGYLGEGGFLAGSVFGVGLAEFLVLVLWWHPIFSFILPLYVYQSLNGTAADGVSLPRWLTQLTWVTAAGAGAMVAFSHQFDLVSALATIIGSAVIVGLAYTVCRREPVPLHRLAFTGIRLWAAGAGLLVVYVLGMVWLLPERFPQSLPPYVFILAWYVVAAVLVQRTRRPLVVAASRPTLNRTVLPVVVAFFVLFGISMFAPVVGGVLVAVWYWMMAAFGVVTLGLAASSLRRPRG